MLKAVPLPAAFVDIETTGGNVANDRIIEIGIVEVTDAGVERWSTLINPRQSIPPVIQRLTGIDDGMVHNAPYFEQVAKEIYLRLKDKLFIAHNVRFDYGFIRNEFSRVAFTFRANLMCTVKLSRALYPDAPGHSLEKIIKRHQIFVADRHRALEDADATFKFVQIAEEEKGVDAVRAAIKNQGKRVSVPPHIPAAVIDALPNTPGVYYFWGEQGELLYVGKSISIRKRVMSHFTSDHQSSKEMRLCQQTVNITYQQTLGELSALILESQEIKSLQPLYNRRLRRLQTLSSIQLYEDDRGVLVPEIIGLENTVPTGDRLYGIFPSPFKAKETLKDLCQQYGLCYQVCGLDATKNRPCMGYQLKRCRGICAEKETAVEHNVRLLDALGSFSLKVWPYDGPVAIIEQAKDGQTQSIVVDNWHILGIAKSQSELFEILESPAPQTLDKDIYRYLVNAVFNRYKKQRIEPLTAYAKKRLPDSD